MALVAPLFSGFGVRFQRGALLAPFFVARLPGSVAGDAVFAEAILGVALAFPG